MPTIQDLAFDYIKNAKTLNHVRVVHLFNKQNPYGGCTIAYKPKLHDSKGYPAGLFADVAIAYCNEKDRYNRKLGEATAVLRLIKGRSVSMPIYKYGQPVLELKQIFQDSFGYGE